jgi:hypothetical protein
MPKRGSARCALVLLARTAAATRTTPAPVWALGRRRFGGLQGVISAVGVAWPARGGAVATAVGAMGVAGALSATLALRFAAAARSVIVPGGGDV